MSHVDQELYDAVCTSNAKLLKKALDRGADVNTLVESGISLLGRAIQIGNEEVIQIIIDAKHYLPLDKLNTQEESDSHTFDWKSLKDNIDEPCVNEGVTLQPESVRKKGVNSADRPKHCGLGLFDSLRRCAFQRHGCDVNLPDFYDRMPIHYAAEVGNVNVVRRLLQAGCRVNVSDNNNITPLHLAVSLQREAVVELLLRTGTRVNCKTSDKCSALHIACSRGFVSIVQMLLRHGANMEILDGSDRTPLLVAVKRAHYDVVKLLLYNGAKTNVEEIHGYTPLSEAVWHNDYQLVEMLLAAGAKIGGKQHLLHFTIRHRSLSLCELLVKSGAFLNNRDDCGDAPVHVAVKTAQIDILALLLNYGSSASLRCGATGKTPVHIAIESISEADFETFSNILQLLLNYGANLDSESYTPGDTPLYRSILLDKFKFGEELIRQGCDPNLGNVFSCTIDNLAFAVRKKHLRTVKLLIYSGFSLEYSSSLVFLKNHTSHSNEIHQFLLDVKRNSMALTKLCRIVIRQNMGGNVVQKVNKLQLPPLLKKYLLFTDNEFS